MKQVVLRPVFILFNRLSFGKADRNQGVNKEDKKNLGFNSLMTQKADTSYRSSSVLQECATLIQKWFVALKGTRDAHAGIVPSS